MMMIMTMMTMTMWRRRGRELEFFLRSCGSFWVRQRCDQLFIFGSLTHLQDGDWIGTCKKGGESS